MGSGTPHAGEQLLHGEAAADHGAEHPFFGLKRLGFQSFEIERFGAGQGPGIGSESFEAIR